MVTPDTDAGTPCGTSPDPFPCPGTGQVKAGNDQTSTTRLRETLRSDPDDPRARFALAAALLRSGNPAASLIEFEYLLEHARRHAGAALGRGLALQALGKREDALAAFRQITETDPLAWKAWGSVADITPDEGERVRALGAAADALAGLTEPIDASPALVVAAAEALIAARRPGQAAALLASHQGPLSGAPLPGLHLARANYHCGRFAEAFCGAARFFKQTRDQKSSLQAQAAFDPDNAVSVLIEILDILSAAGVSAFLTAGTLLGFHRNRGPLTHDRDIDIGVFRDPAGGPDIAAILRRHPGILMPRLARPGERYFGLQHRGVAADIFLHDHRDGGLVCGVSELPGDIQWRFTAFRAADVEYGGRRWNAPANAERFLAETYGPGWEVPDRGFASAVSSPALHLVNTHARACHAVMRAHSALLKGDPEKAAALLRQSPVPLPAPAAVSTLFCRSESHRQILT